jgi:YaiO family outer membrane protein
MKTSKILQINVCAAMLCLSGAGAFAQSAAGRDPAEPSDTQPLAASTVSGAAVGQYPEPILVAPPAALPGEPVSGSRGSVQAGFGYAKLTDGNSDWRDAFVRGNLMLDGGQGVINWEVLEQNHFDESGQGLSLSYTRDLSADWYAMAGLGLGQGGDFLSSQRIDAAVYRKWLSQRQLVTGLQFTGLKSGDKQFTDRTWLLSASYYFDFPLVGELGYKVNTSDPGSVSTSRYYVAASYGRNKDQYVSIRWDSGREGYLPIGFGDALVDFKSDVLTLAWRKWLSRQAGFDLNYEHYTNPTYRRNGVIVSIFYDF